MEGRNKVISDADFIFHSRYAMEDGVWIKEAESFAEKLDKNDYGGSIDFSNFYTAGYDSPWKFWNRRNEVMYLVKTTDA